MKRRNVKLCNVKLGEGKSERGKFHVRTSRKARQEIKLEGVRRKLCTSAGKNGMETGNEFSCRFTADFFIEFNA